MGKEYWRRFIVCNKCKKHERQTATTLPMDELAYKLSAMFEDEFLYLHKKCLSGYIFTDWKYSKFFKEGEY